jgi:unsaturated rhamnogalacturonyl hydrolase
MGDEGVPVGRRVFGLGHHLRPSFIEFLRCRGALVEGVRIVRSPMWEIHPVLSQDVIVRGVNILSHGPNNDGCDPECCRDVLIEDCTFDTGDDCIAIKSGRNSDGRRVGVRSENLVVRGCTMRDGHGGVVIGSEISGGCRNVYVEDCLMDSPMLICALRLKSNAARGGVLENIFMRNVRVGRVSDGVFTIDLLYEEGARGGHPPVIRNVWLGHITSSDSPRVVTIGSFAGATVSDIHIRDSVFRGVVKAEAEVGTGPIDMRGVRTERNPALGPP